MNVSDRKKNFKNKRGKYCQFVIGPAGSGKTTFCRNMAEYCDNLDRHVSILNLDPAGEHVPETVDIDIRDLITLEEAMEVKELGPNGALLFCMEYLLENLDWLKDELGDYEYDYLIVDCPGQLELYNHLSSIPTLINFLQNELEYSVVTLYLVDSLIITDMSKYISATLTCLSTMTHLSTPHLNILTKVDILKKQVSKKQYKKFFNFDTEQVLSKLNEKKFISDNDDEDDDDNSKSNQLAKAIMFILENNNFVSFLPLDLDTDDHLDIILQNVDIAMVYGSEDVLSEPKDDGDDDCDGDGDGDGEQQDSIVDNMDNIKIID